MNSLRIVKLDSCVNTARSRWKKNLRKLHRRSFKPGLQDLVAPALAGLAVILLPSWFHNLALANRRKKLRFPGMHADKDLTAKLSLLHHLQINTHLYLHFGYLLFIFMKPVNKFIFSFVKYSETSVRAEGMEEGKKYHYAISVNCFYIHQPNRYMYQPFNVLETRGRKNSSQVQTLTFFANWGLLCTAFRFSLDFFFFRKHSRWLSLE